MVLSCMLLQHSLLSFQIFQEVTNLALVSTVCKICLVYLVKWQCKAAILQSCVEQKQLVQLICPVTSCENCSFASCTPAQNQPAARVKGHWKKTLKNNYGSNLFWKLNLRELCHLFLVEKVIFRCHHSSFHTAAIQLNSVLQKRLTSNACAKDQITGFFGKVSPNFQQIWRIICTNKKNAARLG